MKFKKRKILNKVFTKICFPPPYKVNIGEIKRRLYWSKPPNFFDDKIFDNWLKTSQFWNDFEQKYSIETKKEIESYFQNKVAEMTEFSEEEKNTYKVEVLKKVKTSVFCPLENSNQYIWNKFNIRNVWGPTEKRTKVAQFIENWVQTEEFWNEMKISPKEYLTSTIYKTLITNDVNYLKTF